MADSIKEQRNKIAQVVESDSSLIGEMVSRLSVSSRRDRQNASSVLSLIASRNPQALVEHVDSFVDALNRPEAQTRWECLDALTYLNEVDSSVFEKAMPGAESALFDEGSGSLHLAAIRFLCKAGSTSSERSMKAWPLIDEAIQCYHGDFEFQDMLNAVAVFAEGDIDDEVKTELKNRLSFDANNGKGILKKRSRQIIDSLS